MPGSRRVRAVGIGGQHSWRRTPWGEEAAEPDAPDRSSPRRSRYTGDVPVASTVAQDWVLFSARDQSVTLDLTDRSRWSLTSQEDRVPWA